jgi:hypothetical protein
MRRHVVNVQRGLFVEPRFVETKCNHRYTGDIEMSIRDGATSLGNLILEANMSAPIASTTRSRLPCSSAYADRPRRRRNDKRAIFTAASHAQRG